MQEFDDLGEDVVRQRLAAHIWSEEEERLARDWLDMRASAQIRVANAAARDRTMQPGAARTRRGSAIG